MSKLRILVYVDPSPRGEWALSMAAQLPLDVVESVQLLATTEDVSANPGLMSHASTRCAAFASNLSESVLAGPAERAVTEEVRQRKYDLVIVPPAGRNAIQRMLKGSRVATLVRRLPASVLVARRPPSQIRTILAAISGGAASDAVVQQSSTLARALGAKLTFLHVSDEISVPGARPQGELEPLDRIQLSMQSRGAPGTLLVRDGIVVDEILREMDTGAHDLLMVGAPSTPESERWARENVVERIILHCPAPVYVVRNSVADQH